MDTILLSSGYGPETLRELKKRWRVIDIPDQREALAWLENCTSLPLALSVGHAQHQHAEQTPSASSSDPMIKAEAMLEAAHRMDPDLPVVISTRESHSSSIVEYVKRGAFDYVIEPDRTGKPEKTERYTRDLVLALQRATQWRATVLENRRLRQRLAEDAVAQPILTRSPRMRRILDLAHKVSTTPATVLITGESGTGKELVAQTIHALSDRARDPFVAINCGALNETLLTSELFGHVKGAFTGADRPKAGLIREAGVGTLFLDEISAVSPGFQALLLRVLEQRKARPVGGDEEYDVRCRFVAAANRDLADLVKRGAFRDDLYYRLHLFPLELPPLRQRKEDIPILAHHFLTHAAKEFRRKAGGFTPAAMRRLEEADWPGNVRQLRNAIERAVILSSGPQIGVAEIEESAPAQRGIAGGFLDAVRYQDYMRSCERRLLLQVIHDCGGNVAEAARRLDMKRTTLAYRLKQVSDANEGPAT